MTRGHLLILFLCLSSAGCVTVPKGFLKLPDDYLANRQLQMRYYSTNNEVKIIASVAGVLQDLGFVIDESESKLGLVVGSKEADATDAGQVAGAVFLDVLSAWGGTYSNNYAKVDAVQKVKAAIVTKPALEGNKILVRVTFQRIVWNQSGQINRVETIKNEEVYQKFYDGLSKAIFLEAHNL